MGELEKAVKNTIRYGHIFGVRYTKEEIETRLISDKEFSQQEIEGYLKGRSKDRRQLERLQLSRKKLNMTKEVVRRIARVFPTILFVGITGSVAAGSAKAGDDVDLMIVTKNQTLWLTRLLVRVWVWGNKVPHRRYGAVEEANQLCFNLWMEEDSLKVPRPKQNLKNAVDSLMIVPVYDSQNVGGKFYKDNQWIGKYSRHGYNQAQNKYRNLSRKKAMKAETGWVVRALNWLVFWPQRWYMRKKIGGGYVTVDQAFFHPSDRIDNGSKDFL